MQGVGVKVDDMGKLFAGFPRLLSYSVDRKLQPVVELLASAGIKAEDIGRVVTKCPQLFCYSIEARLRPVVEFLKSIGVQDSALAKVVLRAPHVLSRNVETVLKPAYESILGMGFSPDKVRWAVGFSAARDFASVSRKAVLKTATAVKLSLAFRLG